MKFLMRRQARAVAPPGYAWTQFELRSNLRTQAQAGPAIWQRSNSYQLIVLVSSLRSNLHRAATPTRPAARDSQKPGERGVSLACGCNKAAQANAPAGLTCVMRRALSEGRCPVTISRSSIVVSPGMREPCDVRSRHARVGGRRSPERRLNANIGDVHMARTPKTSPPETPKGEVPAVNRPVTFDLQDPALQAIIAQAVATAMAAKEAEQVTKPAGKSDQSAKNEILVLKAFKRAGYGIVRPHEDVRTYNRWLAAGLKVKEGEHSLKVGNLRLFHESQVRALTPEEKEEMQAKNDAAVAAAKSKIIAITQPSGAHQ
jgi:hypothetical protein